jgi:4-amino-4-deoxy-L-arabinose transferase-like glycosyltransferase
VDFADDKPPLVYAVHALAQWLGGMGLDSVRWFGAVVLVPSIALAAFAYFRFERTGLAAGLAFVVASSTLFASDGQVVHCEHVMQLPLAWSLVLTRAPRFFSRLALLFAAGVLVGLATLGEQPAALCLVAYGIGVLWFACDAVIVVVGAVIYVRRGPARTAR